MCRHASIHKNRRPHLLSISSGTSHVFSLPFRLSTFLVFVLCGVCFSGDLAIQTAQQITTVVYISFRCDRNISFIYIYLRDIAITTDKCLQETNQGQEPLCHTTIHSFILRQECTTTFSRRPSWRRRVHRQS